MVYAQFILRSIRQNEIHARIFARAFKLFCPTGSQVFAPVKPNPEDNSGRYFQPGVSVPFHAFPASLARIWELHRRNPRLGHRAIKETRARFLSSWGNNAPMALHLSTIQRTFLCDSDIIRFCQSYFDFISFLANSFSHELAE